MNRRRAVFPQWRELGITTKFTVAFGLLLALMVLIATVSVAALILVNRETETAIVTSTEIQRLVLEMDGSLQEARRLEKDFFWRYPTIGYSAAYQTYAQPAERQIVHVRALSAELQQLISESAVSGAWRESDVNLNLYLSAASRHAATVEEAADLLATLAADETGLQAQLAEYSSLLQDTLQLADDVGLMVSYHEMQSLEKDYLIARQRPLMQAAFNAAVPLREAIESAPTLEADQKTQALTHLDNYLTAAEEILELDVAINSKFNEFDLQAEAVDPISAELIALADQEVKRARAQLGQSNRLVMVMVVVTALVGLALAVVIAQGLNNGITRNVVKLTQAAGELQAGNLEVRARIDSADELGQLAGSFNDMATRLSSLIGNLEQKVAERTEALRQERDKAQKYLDIAGVLMVVLNKKGEVTLMNRRGCETLGYEEGEIIGENWFDAFLPASLKEEVRTVFDRLMSGEIEPTKYHENVILTKGGEERLIAWNNTLLKDDEGNPIGSLSSGEDITERKRAEEEVVWLAKFPSENPNPVLRVAQDGTLLYANKAASPLLNIWGCKVSQPLPEHWSEFPADVLTSGGAKEAEVEVKDCILALMFAPVVDAEYLNVYGLDITERKQAQEKLKEHSERLEELVEERTRELREAQEHLVRREKLAVLGQLAGGVGHELRNPLGAIKNATYYLNLVLQDPDANIREMLKILDKEVDTSEKIISSLFDFARPKPPIRRKVNVNDVVQETLSRTPLPDAPRVEVVLELDEDLPPILADPDQLVQVFGNLVRNGVQAMSQGGQVTIKTSEECRGDPGGRPEWVVVSVADSGAGISEENLKKIFEPLFTTKAKGIGLGLALVKTLVEGHGGSIEVESKEEEGSTFTVRLPSRAGPAVERGGV